VKKPLAAGLVLAVVLAACSIEIHPTLIISLDAAAFAPTYPTTWPTSIPTSIPTTYPTVSPIVDASAPVEDADAADVFVPDASCNPWDYPDCIEPYNPRTCCDGPDWRLPK